MEENTHAAEAATSSSEEFRDNSGELIQIIDGEGEFLPLQDVKKSMTTWDILHKGLDYFVVAILGPQSSGKSTLLNLLFGTHFPVMTASEGRTQTTQGVWMGRAKAHSEKEESILVFDVEGTDSRERGEQHASFERKSSLFSLALAEVLIINMWHNDVGRYNAGNISLLKIVFELNLQLFQRSSGPKKLLLFLIRDHIPRETPLEKLKGIILKDMKNIWDGLVKPQEFENTSVEDFFDFHFSALPHKILAEDEFNKDIGLLRNRFVDASSPNFILGSDQIHRKDIPADGFPLFAFSIWKTIKENKDLNIPTQKQMLAIYRCDEISSEILKNFSSEIAPLKKTLDHGDIVDDFGTKAGKQYNEALASYDSQAYRYHKDIADQKKETLSANMNETLNVLFNKQLVKISEKSVEFFDKLMEEALPSDGTAVKDFKKVKNTVLTSTQSYFTERAAGSLVSGLNWDYQVQLEELQTALAKHSDVVKASQLEKLVNELKNAFTTQFVKTLDRILDSPDSGMWQKIRGRYLETQEKLLAKLRERLEAGFDMTEEEVAEECQQLDKSIYKAFKDKFTEKSKYLNYIMSKRFEQDFNLDEQGLPRRWKPTDDIPKVFIEAKQKAEELIELFAVIRLKEEYDGKVFLDAESTNYDDLDNEEIVFTLDDAKVVREKFYREAQSSYLQAKRDQENVSSSAHVPVYVILLIMVLGFDEFIHLISNPLLLMLVLMVGGGVYVLNMLNMMGPAKKLLETGLWGAVATIQQTVSQQMEQYHKENNERKEKNE